MSSIAPERFRYEVDANGCHIWQRARNNRGYGVIWFDGKVCLAHRVAWFVKHGIWPPLLDHRCDNKGCVNADHLRPLSNSANIRRAYPRGDAATEKRRARWRAANARRRNYAPGYSVGSE